MVKGSLVNVAVVAIAVIEAGLRLSAQDRAAEVLPAMRAALGGDKLAAVKALSVEGPILRQIGDRQIKGTVTLTLQLPDRLHRSEETEMPGGISIERVSALAGEKAWEDIRNRGGLGGGAFIGFRQGPPGQELSPDAVEQARVARLRTELLRNLLAFLGAETLQPAYGGVATAPDGTADVLEVMDPRGQVVRLFVDQRTHLPLMLQYQDVRPRVLLGGPGRGFGGPGGRLGGSPPDPEEIRRRIEAQGLPQPSKIELFLADYRAVDGLRVPQRLTQSADGEAFEEWTIEKVTVNPSIRADLFEKK
jgi:hypothetical protein